MRAATPKEFRIRRIPHGSLTVPPQTGLAAPVVPGSGSRQSHADTCRKIGECLRFQHVAIHPDLLYRQDTTVKRSRHQCHEAGILAAAA